MTKQEVYKKIKKILAKDIRFKDATIKIKFTNNLLNKLLIINIVFIYFDVA